MQRLLFPLLLATASLTAQDPQRPYLHGQLGLAAGRFSFDSDTSGFDDHKAAALVSLEVEGTSRKGIGGGLRFEGVGIDNGEDDDDGLFRDSSDPNDLGFDANNATLFGHFTFRIQEHRFAMPFRIGLLFNGLILEDNNTGNQTTYASFGPCFEVEPEVTVVARGRFRMSLYGLLGVGACGTSIDVEGDPRDYDSTTAFVNVEAGVRARYAFGELGLAYIGRFQSMDRSDIENGSFVVGYDANFQGLLFTFGVVF